MDEQRKGTVFGSVFDKRASHLATLVQWMDDDVRSDKHKKLVEEMRLCRRKGEHERAEELKKRLPGFVVAGECMEGRKPDCLGMRTGLAMFDADHLPERLLDRKASLLMERCPWVQAVHVTSSGQGLRIFARVGLVHLRRYAQVYRMVAARLEQVMGHPLDLQCKDPCRISFASWDPAARLRTEEAEVFPYPDDFDPYHAPDEPPAPPLPVPGGRRQDAGAPVPPPQVQAVDGGQAAAFLERFLRYNPFVKGERNAFFIRLGQRARYKGLDAAALEALKQEALARLGGGEVTAPYVASRLDWGYAHAEPAPATAEGAGTPESHFSHFSHYRDEKSDISGTDAIDQDDEDKLVRQNCPTLPDDLFDRLPALLTDGLTLARTPRQRDILLLAVLTNLSGCLPGVSMLYARKRFSPHLFSMVVAPAGSGKGVMTYAARLPEAIQREMDEDYKRVRTGYDRKLLAWENEKKRAGRAGRDPDFTLDPGPEPVRRAISLPPTISRSQLMLSLEAMQDEGVIINASEIDELSSALASDYGHHTAELRKIAMQEPVGQSFKVDGRPVRIPNPRMALCISGTPNQVAGFIPSAEDGMSSRFLVALLESSSEWQTAAPDASGTDGASLFDSLAERVHQAYRFLLQSPTEVVLTPAQWAEHDRFFTQAFLRVKLENESHVQAIVVRHGLHAARLAMVLTALRKCEAGFAATRMTCTDDDFHAALTLARTFLEHSLQLSTILPGSEVKRRPMRSFFRLQPVLEAMPREFLRVDFVRQAQEQGISRSAAYRMMDRLEKEGQVSRQGDKLVKPVPG